jgi:hypothetical protein
MTQGSTEDNGLLIWEVTENPGYFHSSREHFVNYLVSKQQGTLCQQLSFIAEGNRLVQLSFFVAGNINVIENKLTKKRHFLVLCF